MNISETNDHDGKSQPYNQRYPDGYVLHATEIAEFVNDLRIGECHQIMPLLLSASYALGRSHDLAEADFLLVKQIAEEHDNQGYRRIMNAVVAALEYGEPGISAADATITRILVLASPYGPDYSLAPACYEDHLVSHIAIESDA